jgi:hypothetical protein
MVSSWIAAFESWAPIEWIEPAPVAIARALVRQRDGTWRVEAGAGETGLLLMKGGHLQSVRRTHDAAAGTDARALNATEGTPAAFVAALATARWQPHHARGAPALAPGAWRRRLASRQRTTTVIGTITAVAAILFAVWAADRWRERTLDTLEARIAQAEAQAAPADNALRMLRSREVEATTIREIAANRADPFRALAALSAALPREATVLSARASGDDWQVDGTTSDASTLVPLLDRHERFDSVRFLSASSRYREANRSYETFSIALRFRSQP